jgi:hypothetical protein
MIPEKHSKRGQLIHFKAWLGDKCLADWQGVQHTRNTAHAFGKRKHGPFEFNAGFGDAITEIPHGILIERQIKP